MSLSGTSQGLTLADFDDPSCLICGIGNVGRQDDGLGWAFIDWLEDTATCASSQRVKRYQLALEDADLISTTSRVLFVDATKDPSVDDLLIEAAEPAFDLTFTSHSISVPTIVATCEQCFGRVPDAYFLQIRGYRWDLGEGLSPGALRNLDSAKRALLPG